MDIRAFNFGSSYTVPKIKAFTKKCWNGNGYYCFYLQGGTIVSF